jgi:hypothetical protein
MADEVPPVGRVRLARSAWRLLALPGMVAIGALVIIASGLVVGGPLGVGLAAGAGVILLLAVAAGALLLSVRLDVDVAGLQLRWLGGGRRYELVPGRLTRAALRGGSPSALHAGLSAFGWALGPAVLRGEEEIEVVRLAPTPSAILVPTNRGRLAICPASEDELVAQLTATARIKQRLDQVAGGLGWAQSLAPVAAPPGPTVPAEPQPEPEAEARPPHLLTGIERMLLEQRLAEEQAALAAALAAERQAEAAAAVVEPVPPPVPLPPPRVVPLRRPRTRAAWTRPAWMPAIPRPGRRFAAFLSPLAAAGAVWLVARTTGAASGASDAVRLLLLAVLLGGPAATLAALAAQIWWPRMVGLVLVTGVAGLILVGRALVD